MKLIPLISTLFFSSSLFIFSQTTTILTPVKDNSIYSESNNSNGIGRLYSGKTGSNNGENLRRTLIEFDVSSIPTGAIISSVSLTLRVNGSAPASGTQSYSIYQVTKEWGESTSYGTGAGGVAVAPDATWSSAMLGTSTWTNLGGDYSSTPIATTNISGVGNYTFSSNSNWINLVKDWIDNPSTNHGIILIGNEGVSQSAREFDSKDLGTTPPKLSVTYTSPLGVDDLALDNFNIYPNPTQSKINIEIPKRFNSSSISAYNILGKEIFKLTFLNKETIDVSKWNNGLYLLKVSSGGKTLTKRFVKN